MIKFLLTKIDTGKKNNKEGLQEIVDTSRVQPRKLRTITQLGCSTRRNYIRQSKPCHSVHEKPSASVDESSYIESPYFSNLVSDMIVKNNNDDLPNTIDKARESPDKTNWMNAIQTELGMYSEKKT